MKESVLCWGGDGRMRILAERLRTLGFRGRWVSGELIPEYGENDWWVFPIPTLDSAGYLSGSCGNFRQEDILATLPEKSRVIAYLEPKVAEKWRWQRPDLQLRLMNTDELFLSENGKISAEGAMIRASTRGTCLFSSKCIVLGYGKIGRALCRMLRGVGAKVIAVGRSGGSLEQAYKDGIEARDFAAWHEVLPQADWVMNTIPYPVMGNKELSLLRSGCKLMELASAPYGIDKEAAMDLGLDYTLEASIPGRFYPRSAAEAMLGSVCRIIQDEEGKDES